MKTHFLFVPAFFLLAALAGAQTPEAVSPEPVVVERGPHYRVWQRTVKETLANGGVVTRRSGYTELAVGMHYLKDDLWTESKEEIELFQDGAIARQGQIRMALSLALCISGVVFPVSIAMSDFLELTARFIEQRIGLGPAFDRAGFPAARPFGNFIQGDDSQQVGY